MRTTITIFILLMSALSLSAQLAQWRGPNRDGIFNETGLLKEWPADGPAQILEVEKIGKGWSSPIFYNNMIYTTGMIDTLDYLSAIDMDGNIKWQVSYGRSWNQSFPDTRSTPTVEDDRIYVQSGTGRLVCLNRETGKEIWAVDVDKEFECQYHVWGNAETPLIVDDKVICTPGGQKTSVVAFDKMTGELAWQSESIGGPRAYASATVYEFNGHRFVLAVIASHLIALDPNSGEIKWTYQYWKPKEWKWQDNGLIWTNTPLCKDNRIFITMGYDYPAVMLEMDSLGSGVSEVFVDHTFDNHHHGVILYDGYLYGSNWFDNKRGRWVCMSWNTGEIKYVADWDTKGSLVMADGMLYAYNERGNVGLVKPDPDGFEVVSQFRISKGAGTHWAHPFIADSKLFMRHGEVLMVYDIKNK
ncbi:PQQ-binding-like beta-propeller repeat protein [Maribellus maritimus]|uniref:PQQ-binding-like beta-propeller repeat protein n=1 Tax=Maribellus maritimus TaxID=2870838 RepID=UPI001EEA2320|nr:PQQ-binding-like beta-propeller repeat protein [Maribellus maritimus]MCG6185789.1 PQQ-like beta-propeller repeat protein [Maribellus maritimus]